MKTVRSIEEWLDLAGQYLGCSGWLCVTQETINRFAEATDDYQWIHTDPERARQESPFHSTIAHGYLMLLLIPSFVRQIVNVENVKQVINYGLDKVIFRSPVPVDSELRLCITLKTVKDLGEGCVTTFWINLEIKESHGVKTVVDGLIKYIYYFNK